MLPALFALGAGVAQAQFTFSEDFKGTTAAGWVLGSGGGTYTPQLTGAIPLANGGDAPGSGWLRMTDLSANAATYARLTTPIPSANNNINLKIDLAMWNSGSGGAADGMTISLRDAAVPFATGAYGGSLGYANRTGVAGMAGGYFSLGIDNFGNFSNPTEGRVGGTGFFPNAIATRGPESGGYAYLGGTGTLATSLDFPNATTRPVQGGVDYRQLEFNLDSSSMLTVSLRFGLLGTLTPVYSADLSGYARPENLELVYTGSTGGYQQVNELRSLVITTTAAPIGNVYYSNYANDNKWGTGTNWGNALTPNLGNVPGNGANLVFSNNNFTSPAFQLTTAQTVDLQQNRTAASLQFDAPFNYTLQGYQLTLDNGGGSTAITVTSAQPGGAHTIQSNLVLNSDLTINTNTNTALVLSGSLNAGAKNITLNNLGTTTFGGQITGSGTMTQLSAGTIVVSGNSSSTYTGNIDIQKGMLQLGGSNVLNANTNLSLSSNNDSGTFFLANNNQTLGSLTFASGGTVTTGAGILTMGGNVTSNASVREAAFLGNLDLGGAIRTFNVADGSVPSGIDMNIAATVSGTNGGINKTGAGTLLMSGNNSFTGANTIAAGTLIAASENALGTAASSTSTTVASGATLGLQGGINLSAFEAITLSGTGDTGRNGALDNLSGINSVAGPVTLAANTTIGAASATILTVAGAVGEIGGTRALTAGGAGTIVLSGSNTYTGTTTVNAGTTLVAAANNALGTNAAGTTVNTGGTLGFQGGINYTTAEALSVRGTGVAGSNGAIDNLSGNNTFAGPVTMVANTTMGAASGTQLTLAGAIGESGGARALTANGAGTLVLSGNNTYTGSTTVNAGTTLVAAANNALGTNTGSTTVSSGATLGFQGNINYTTTEALSVRGTGATASGRTGAIENISGTNSFSGPVALAAATTISTADSSQLTLAGVVSGAQNLTKTGGGTLVLTAADTYSGTTTVNAGTLALSGAGTIANTTGITVTDATLRIDNTSANSNTRIGNATPITLNDGTFTFIGQTAGNTTETVGNLTLGSGANTLNIATGGSTRYADLTLGDVIRNGSSSLTINSYSDAAMTTRSTLGAGLTSAGTAGSPRVFITTNNFNNSGGPTLTSATLAAPVALPGWITTVTSTGATEFVEYSGDSGTGNGLRPITAYTGPLGININDQTKVVQLDSASPVGAYLLNNPGPTANNGGAGGGKVTVDGGLKLLDVATVNLNTDATYRLVLMNGGLIKSGSTTTNLAGSGALTSGNGFIAATVDSAAGVLNITAPIINNDTAYGTAGTVGLNKAGPGLLILGGTNTYTGSNFLNDGTVRISTEANLGAVTNDVSFSGGTLNVTNSFTANTGKIFTVTPNQTGTLDIDSGATLTLANTAGVLSTSSNTAGVLVKAGLGSLVIQNANTAFDGTLQINAGTVEIRNAQSLGDATNRGRVTLAGGTLDLRNNAATSFNNNVTVTADSTINVDRVSGTNTDLVHTLGTLAMGANTLSVTGGNGFDLTFGATTLNGAATFSVSPGTTDLRLGAVSGAGSLTKAGAGTMILTGTNTYTEATAIDAGTIRLNTAGSTLPAGTNLTIGTGTLDMGGFNQTVASLAGGGTVAMGVGSLTTGAGNTNSIYSGIISGTGGVTKTGTGIMTLQGANTFTGALNINQGTIAYAASDVIADSVTVTVAAAGTLNLSGNSDTIGSLAGVGAVQLGSGTLTTGGNNSSTAYSGTLSGTGNLVKQGTGTMTVSGSNTYSGTTTVSAGTLAISSASALGTGDGTAGTGTTIGSGATLQISGAINVANEALTLSGTLQNVSGNNSFGGPVTLANPALVTVNAGNLTLGGAVANAGNTLTVGGPGNTIAAGAITGTGGLTKTGAGTLVLETIGNTYSGATTINGGSIQIGVNFGGPSSSAVTIASGAALNVNDYTAAIASLTGSAGSSVILGSGTLASGADNTSTTFAGVVSGAGGNFAKNGAGTLTLSGSNTYTGTTTINAGTLAASANNVLSNQTAVTVANGASFTLNNTTQAVGSIAGAGTVSIGGGQFVAGANNTSTTFSGAMTGTGTFTKDGTGTLTLTGTNSYSGPTTIANGTLALGANNVLSNSTSLTISNGATFAAGAGVTDTIAGLVTNATSTINLAANSVLTVDRASASTLLGSLTGTGTIAYTGGGNLTLGSGLNFSTGTLAFGGTTIGGTPTSTLFLGGSTTMLGTLHITGDTILDFGNNSASTLDLSNIKIDTGVKITIRNWIDGIDYFYAQNWLAGTTPPNLGDRGVGDQLQVSFDGFSNNATYWFQDGAKRPITPTPEPATYGALLIGAAFAFIGFRRWRISSTTKA